MLFIFLLCPSCKSIGLELNNPDIKREYDNINILKIQKKG